MKRLSLLSLFLLFTFTTGLKAQLPNSPEEIEAYKLQMINNPHDTEELPTQSFVNSPESLTDFNLQFFYELTGPMGEAAVETDGEYIYVGKWNDTPIDKYDLDGNLIETFTIADIGHFCDFAWDGSRLYATDGSSFVYEIDPVNKVLTGTIVTEHLLRGIAYNDNEDVFYGSNLSSPIVSFDRQGNTVDQYPLQVISGLYGLAFDNVSPDGPYLWGFSQFSSVLVQYSVPDIIETGVTFSVNDDLGLPDAVAGGLAFSDNISPGTVSLLGILQSQAIFAYSAGQTVNFDNDVAVISILSPNSGVGLTANEPVTVRVKNYGNNPQTDVPVSFSLDGGEPFTGTLAGTIEPGEIIEYTFNQSVDLSTPDQTYTITACTNLASDEFTENDCKTAQVTHQIPVYCIPQASCTFGDGFEIFTLEAIENINSGCSPQGYGDFTNLITDLQAGETYSISWASGYGSNYASLWIDLNQNKVFEENERLITDYDMFQAGEIYTTEFTIPEDAMDGETRLRIRARWLHSSADPCEYFSFGETEDYSVFILNTPLAKNVGIKSLDLDPVLEAGLITPQAVVRNYGTEAQSFPVELTIGDYAAMVQVEDLAPETEIVVEFDVWNAQPGPYEATVCTQLEGDEFTQNDCKSKEVTVINALSAYGYVNFDNTGQFDGSWVALDLANPGSLLEITNPGLSTPIIGATYVGDLIYAVDFNGYIYEFNPATGTHELLWDNTPQYFGIAFDGTDFYTHTLNQLYKFDMTTGEATLIGSFTDAPSGIISIAFDGSGALYGIDLTNDELRAINRETAETTLIGPLGKNFNYLGDISFDKVNNILYFAGFQNSSGLSEIHILSTETGTATALGQLQNNVQLTGLAIVSDSNFTYPPRNLSALISGNDAVLTWDEPFGGNAINYNVYRDEVLIATTAGTEYVDESLQIGLYSYTITAVYEEGESDPAGPVEVAIGNAELVFNPESIDAVLEMGESLITQITLFNNGNINLNYELSPVFNAQSTTQPARPEINKKDFERAAAQRFGDDWQTLLNTEPAYQSPEGLDAYCTPSANCIFGDGLGIFLLGDINNTASGCSPNGYGDFTNLETSLDAGMSYELTVASGYSDNFLNIWVDLNQNEIFEANELLIDGFPMDIAGEIYTTQLTIPEGTLQGPTRLRAIATWINPASDPCSVSTFGEIEDYTVNIGGISPWIALQPASGSIAPGDSAVINVTLDASTLDPIQYMGKINISSNDTSNLLSEIPVTLTVIEQGISNFFPVWETPFNPMSIFVVGATLDSLDLDLGDEIGVFDVDPNTGEEICVGAGLVISPLSPDNILEITVSMNDGSNPDQANGFTPGNEIIYRMWNSLTGEVDDVTAVYPNPGFDETFTPLGTAITELSGSALVMQPLNLTQGWNLVSSRAQPHNTNMMSVFQPLIDLDILEKVIDEDGGTMVYLPYPAPDGRWNNSIGDMQMAEGYYVKVSESSDAMMYGLPVELPMEMPLEAGWNIMGYPAEAQQNALEMLTPLIEAGNLYKVIDEAGGVIQYLPFPEPDGQWINTIGDLQNGQGYYIKVYEETSLTVTEPQNIKTAPQYKNGSSVTEFFEPAYQNNPYMPMHFILYAEALEPGDEVGIYDGDVCVGASVYDGNSQHMTITVTSMDDPDTENTDGYTAGNFFTVSVYKSGTLFENIEITSISGLETFMALETFIGEITETITSVGDASADSNSLQVSPNPADDALRININLKNPAGAKISLIRIDGTLAQEIYDGNLQEGSNIISTRIDGVAPGVYILRANIAGDAPQQILKKVIVK
ncbi:MAG: GEVED domain-containing protein [Bacteroidales bacterium]